MKALLILLIPLFLFSCAKYHNYEYSYEIEVRYMDNSLDTLSGVISYRSDHNWDYECRLTKVGCIHCGDTGYTACNVRTFRFLQESNQIK